MKKSSKTNDENLSAFFIAVQQNEIDKVNSMLRDCPEILKCANRDGFSALDVATMLNRREVSELLLRCGSQENCQHRLDKLKTLIDCAEKKLSDASGQPTTSNKADEVTSQLESHLHTLKEMRNNVTALSTVPAQPRCFLQVASASSLVIWFNDINTLSPIATKYKVEWSSDPEFNDVQTMIIVDLQQPCATISNLCSNINYYVRAYAGNFKGFSEAAVPSPLCLSPSCWRDLSPQLFPRATNLETASVLMDRVKKLEKDDFSYSSIQAEGASEKRRKLSFKNLLLTDNRLHKGNKSGLYVAAVLYRGNKVLHTFEDQIPLVQIDSSGPTTIASQFQWFLKLCCVKSLPSVSCTGESVSHCSVLTYRVKLIQAMRTLQAILGQDDLGIAHFRPIVDRNESAVFVTVKNVESSRYIPGFPFKWYSIEKLKRRVSLPVSKEETLDRLLLKSVEECVSYHRSSTVKLEDGLYMGYVKLESSLSEMKILSAEFPSNVIPFARVRKNAHVSRDEWEWLRSFKEENDETSCPNICQLLFHWEVVNAANDLLRRQMGLKEEEVELVQVYLHEVVEITDTVSFIFLLPPDNIRFIPNPESEAENSDCHVCPVKVLEIVNLRLYYPEFMSDVSYVSSFLDIHTAVLRWLLRQALDNREENELQQRLKQCVSLQHEVEHLWTSSRWIGTIISEIRSNAKDHRIALGDMLNYFRQNEEEFQKIINEVPYGWLVPSPEEEESADVKNAEYEVEEPEHQSDSGCYSDHSVDRCSCADVGHLSVLYKNKELEQKSDSVSTISGRDIRRKHLYGRPSSLKCQSVEETQEIPFIPLQSSASETSCNRLNTRCVPKVNISKQHLSETADVKNDGNLKNPISNETIDNNSRPIRQAQSSMDISQSKLLRKVASTHNHCVSEGSLYEKTRMQQPSACSLPAEQSNGNSLHSENVDVDLASIDQLYLRRKYLLSEKKAEVQSFQAELNKNSLSNSQEKIKFTNNGKNLMPVQPEVRSVKVHLAFPGVFPDIASVSLRITGNVTAKDVIEQVTKRYSNVVSLDTDKLEQLCLVVVLGARERCLRDDYPILCLKYPWHKGKLLIRRRSDLLTALECGNEAEV
ncbi:hypothetical protein M513_02926 [Trichuris suis]|uniref:Ankyrin repeat and fibronectin type-III domain-containing protein 1 n=1 Tax=Trichuris suis TaxID=68888 RepID=A0A085MG02_9BILA|nr:hypothetical protein M513_02926 [Trichuris suis]